MKRIHRCPYCEEICPQVDDTEVEELGFFAFDCFNCGEKFMAPKDSPLIEQTDD